jgi:hypothetical protein
VVLSQKNRTIKVLKEAKNNFKFKKRLFKTKNSFSFRTQLAKASVPSTLSQIKLDVGGWPEYEHRKRLGKKKSVTDLLRESSTFVPPLYTESFQSTCERRNEASPILQPRIQAPIFVPIERAHFPYRLLRRKENSTGTATPQLTESLHTTTSLVRSPWRKEPKSFI